ncbi:sulfotransferase 1C2-like isoform X8 [Erpetoichthys calabaricus]|uniref:sulfotransferase 1C2-like isoform X8 n=1 Tax=Erpetoichthys calabaricus TaxID=27687 RepID=UPI002233F811|nr:sulfotransferase 1C2-like isoform X8 [Erpetoichthys calabaricus]
MSESLGAPHHEACNSGPPNPTRRTERQRLCDVKGVPLISSMHEIFGRVEKFQAKADDVLIATYPKAGTTWMIEIMDSIRQGGITKEIKTIPSHERAPFLEMNRIDTVPAGLDLLKDLPSPRLVKTHLPFQLVPQSFWDKGCKTIYVARNAKDVLVSYYFFHKMATSLPNTGTWDDFFESYLSGNVAWGSWFDHVTGWWDVREKHQILYVFYEDILQDPMREVERVARFLGHTLDNGTIQEIVKHTSFNMMKDNPMTNFSRMPTCIVDVRISPFMRKGQVGDWKNHFTVAQNKRFKEEYMRRMAKTSLRFRTEL